ncbi:hypothetical protein [Aquisediminimonas sediminicola]|uniref:hypothetical protein n=1 Tax=Alteraquisediminimonas sediminicola TaxID=2676787 RepID=UPI001C8E6C8E|nr:hypothetical protein [Aquisediminimonas sediminicola]
MQFLKTLFWVMLAVIAVAFAANNWIVVSIKLWGETSLDTKLPVLMLVSFLLGLVPLLLWHHASKWLLRRKLSRLEAALANEQATRPHDRLDPLDKDASDLTPAPSAAPMAVPPGVA